jgi:hypothetical protein
MPPETNAICTLSGSAEEMRAHEERLLQEGYVRVPAITPDVELLAFQYKWQESSPPISPLSNTTITLTWRKKNEQS